MEGNLETDNTRPQSSKRIVSIKADTLSKRSLTYILILACLSIGIIYIATAFLLPNVFVSPSSVEECPDQSIDFRGRIKKGSAIKFLYSIQINGHLICSV